jgi:hypothetical protein
VLVRPTATNSSTEPRPPAELADTGWQATDMWLLTSVSPMVVPERTPWCLRAVRVLYGEPGILMVWHPLEAAYDWDPYRALQSELLHPLALPECKRRHGHLTTIRGVGGVHEAGRLVQDIMQHHDWTEWQLTQRVEHWERQFFELARDGAFDPGLDARHLGVALDETHQLLSRLRQVNRDIARRARLSWLPRPAIEMRSLDVDSLADEVQERSRRVGERLDDLNGSLREGWTLLSSAAGGARLQLDRLSGERTQGFQNAAGLVAALVLVPGLVLSLYGAEVAGLPGMGGRFGLVAILIYATVGAGATFAALRAMAHRRRVAATATLITGFLVLVMVTVIMLRLGQGS